MIRPFGLRDLLAVRQLQRNGVWLDLSHCLIQRRSPLTMALIAPVPWRGTGLASYVWQGSDAIRGFVQLVKRPARPEADILFVAPALERRPEALPVWQELLDFCVRSSGRLGLRRLFASLPEDSAEIAVLTRRGFVVYSKEDVFRLARPPAALGSPGATRLRPQDPADAWWLRRLYSLYTPAPVQQAEGMGEREEPTAIPLAWWEPGQQRCQILEENGEVKGCVQLVSGRRGHWLLLHGDHRHGNHMSLLLQQGLHLLVGSRWPVYCAVRDYQGGLRSLLQDQGFEHMAHRSRLVKHMVVPVKASEPSAVPAFAVEQSS